MFFREVGGPKLNAQRPFGRRRVGGGNFVVAEIFILAFALFVFVSVVGRLVGQDGGQAGRVTVGQADFEGVRVGGIRRGIRRGVRRGNDEFDVAQVEVERVIVLREEFQRQRVPGDGRFGGQRVGESGRQFDGVRPIAFAEILREVDFDRFAERRGDVGDRSDRFRRDDFFGRELESAAIDRRAVVRRGVAENLRVFDRNPAFVRDSAAANGRDVVRKNRVFEVKVAGVGDRAAEVRRAVRNFDRAELNRPALDRERAVDVVRVDLERSVVPDDRQGALRRGVEFDRDRFVARLEGQRSAADDKDRVVARGRSGLRDSGVERVERQFVFRDLDRRNGVRRVIAERLVPVERGQNLRRNGQQPAIFQSLRREASRFHRSAFAALLGFALKISKNTRHRRFLLAKCFAAAPSPTEPTSSLKNFNALPSPAVVNATPTATPPDSLFDAERVL